MNVKISTIKKISGQYVIIYLCYNSNTRREILYRSKNVHLLNGFEENIIVISLGGINIKPLNKLLSFYKDYYKELHQDTINSPYFSIMLEFDIIARFNFRPTKEQLNKIIKAIQGG